MHTLKNVAIGIMGTLVFALAVRTGMHAEQAATR
jgi:hypothetical protein